MLLFRYFLIFIFDQEKFLSDSLSVSKAKMKIKFSYNVINAFKSHKKTQNSNILTVLLTDYSKGTLKVH